MNPENKKAYIVAVDMGYGHQRAAYPFLADAATPAEWNFSKPTVIAVNNYPGIPASDRLLWKFVQKSYELFSRTYTVPLIGKYIYKLLDAIEIIPPFYPIRDESAPAMQSRMLYWTIKRGHGKHFIETLNKNPLPFFTSYFVAAFFAEEHGYKGDIYCLCTDTDISRAWAPLNGEKSRIIYCAPDERVKERLKLYGVSPDKIVLTGFPIPKEILGDKDKLDAIKSSLARRLSKVDPNGKYTTKRSELIKDQLGAEYPLIADAKPLTVTFAVGGAGAQYKIGIAVLKSLAEQIRDGKIKLNLIAGTSMRIFKKYRNALKKSSLVKNDEKGVEIIYDHDMAGYMHKFNKVIIETDVLWTKPSELSFYAGAGLPIIIAPPLGAQEESNQEWLHINGAGIDQPNPKYANEWLHDTLEQGTLAEIAMNAYINISKHGVYHIEKLIFQKEK